MRRLSHRLFTAAALLCLPLFLFFLVLVVAQHPLLIAWRDRPWLYVPYWDPMPH